MGVYWKVDVDEPNYHVPTLQIEAGDIRHVDFTGKEIPADEPADSITVQRGDRYYYLDYHIYVMTITIRTIADKNIYKKPGMIPFFEHETSWEAEAGEKSPPYTWNDENRIGMPFKGGVYVKFVISPWRGFTYREPPNDEYTLENCWAGVMNAYVFRREMGQVENQWGDMPDPDPWAPMYFKAGLDVGNQVPMFKDDETFGTPAPRVDWDPSVTPDERIESTVVLYLPAELLAGAKFHTDIWTTIDDIYPCDVYVMYTLRIDVLTIHGFALQTAINPPEPQPPSDWFTWFKGFWENVAAWFSSVFGNPMFGFIFMLLLIIIVLVVLAVFAPGVLAAVSALGKRAAEAIKPKKRRQAIKRKKKRRPG